MFELLPSQSTVEILFFSYPSLFSWILFDSADVNSMVKTTRVPQVITLLCKRVKNMIYFLRKRRKRSKMRKLIGVDVIHQIWRDAF